MKGPFGTPTWVSPVVLAFPLALLTNIVGAYTRSWVWALGTGVFAYVLSLFLLHLLDVWLQGRRKNSS